MVIRAKQVVAGDQISFGGFKYLVISVSSSPKGTRCYLTVVSNSPDEQTLKLFSTTRVELL